MLINILIKAENASKYSLNILYEITLKLASKGTI